MRDRNTSRVALVAALCALALAVPSAAVEVNSADDLLPADFWVFVEGNDGGFARVEARDDAPVSIEIENPVVDGIALSGHLILRAQRLRTGPATTANAVLVATNASAIDTKLDLRARITFDVAVLSASLSGAAVRIIGRGLAGAYGYLGDGPDGSTSSSSGSVTLYATDSTGGTGAVVES